MGSSVKFVALLLIALVMGFGIGYWLLPKQPNVLTEQQVRQIIRERPGSMHFEVKPETIEFQSLKLVCLRKATQTYVWIVDYEMDGRGRGIVGVRISTTTGEEEVVESPFRRMHFQRQIDARSGREIWTSVLSELDEMDDC